MRHLLRLSAALRAASLASLSLAALLSVSAHAQVAPVADRAYRGREAEIEACMATADVVKYQDLPVGLTRPARAWLAPGGPCSSVAWKPLRPGMYKGFYESYKSEIAAYELSKLLQLHMVPPTIERQLNGVRGALIMWIDGVRMWKDLGKDKPATRGWNEQVIRMTMFDALIGNIDRNAGNILVDGNWTMYLIDHSRAFTTLSRPPVKLAQVDAALWRRMLGLEEAPLEAAIGKWVDREKIRAILSRRARMQQQIDDLVKKRGEASVYIDR
jgi:hypothetical protein